MSQADIRMVALGLRAALIDDARPIMMRDDAGGGTTRLSPGMIAAPDGLLPMVLRAGSAIWHLATGHPYRLRLVSDEAALLGQRVEAIAGTSPLMVVLSAIEALDQVSGPDGIAAHNLPRLEARIRAEAESYWRPRANALDAVPPMPGPASATLSPGAG